MKHVQLCALAASIMLSTSVTAAPGLDGSFNGVGQRNVYFDLPSEKWDDSLR